MQINELVRLQEMVVSQETMPEIKRGIMDLFKKNPIGELREEQLLEVLRFMHKVKMEMAKVRAPHIISAARYQEMAKEAKTRQDLIFLVMKLGSNLINDFNRLAATSSKEVVDFIERAKFHAVAISDKLMEEIGGQALPDTDRIDAEYNPVEKVFENRFTGQDH